MSQIFGTLIASSVGLFIWLLSGILAGTGSGIYNSMSLPEKLVFISPIICLVVPAAIRSLSRGAAIAAAWMLALAPILGFINTFIALAIAEVAGKTPEALNASMISVAAVWLIALWRYLKLAFNAKSVEFNDETGHNEKMLFCSVCNQETSSADENCMWCGSALTPNSKLNSDA